jgi:hypothetical protein
MLEGPRRHAVRARVRQLQDIDAMPHALWRLHAVGKDAYASALMAQKINELLAGRREKTRLQARAYESLAEVAALIGRDERAIA